MLRNDFTLKSRQFVIEITDLTRQKKWFSGSYREKGKRKDKEERRPRNTHVRNDILLNFGRLQLSDSCLTCVHSSAFRTWSDPCSILRNKMASNLYKFTYDARSPNEINPWPVPPNCVDGENIQHLKIFETKIKPHFCPGTARRLQSDSTGGQRVPCDYAVADITTAHVALRLMMFVKCIRTFYVLDQSHHNVLIRCVDSTILTPVWVALSVARYPSGHVCLHRRANWRGNDKNTFQNPEYTAIDSNVDDERVELLHPPHDNTMQEQGITLLRAWPPMVLPH